VSSAELIGWDRLRHGGLLLDPPRLRRIAAPVRDPLSPFTERELRRLASGVLDGSADVPEFVTFVLQVVCGFSADGGTWQRGAQVGGEWGRRSVMGETVKPRQLWRGGNDAILPVFFDSEARLGIGRGRKATSQTVQWLRSGSERLALLTNGRQWRLVFAGLDFDAWCEWDVDLWFEEGTLSSQVDALRALLSPTLWTPPTKDAPCPLLEAILDSRKGQAELSAVLGERVREAVELLVQGHGDVLRERCVDVDPADMYRAAVRVVMRMVVVLFAESRELLPRDSTLYHGAYGLTGLLEELEKIAARGGNRLARSWNSWPRVLALFRLVHQGSHHPALPVPAYGGELFAEGDAGSPDGLSRALAAFESACFDSEILSDRDVYRMLQRITRTRVKVRQGHSSTWVPVPVDFSDLSSEYIGILYEGLLDFELKTAPAGDPVVFLAVGNQPALPLSRLEAMDDRALASLLEKMKDTSPADEEAAESEEGVSEDGEAVADQEEDGNDEVTAAETEAIEAGEEAHLGDERHTTRTRAEVWARRAVEVGKLTRKPRGGMTPEKRMVYEEAVSRKSRQLVIRVVLPGEWYLARWGGTRKGSGTFYTRPGLAVPTVQRALRPLVYTPPVGADGQPDLDAPHTGWTPKLPEEILALNVCDPACGSGTFPVAALRFLTEALFASLHHHARISADGDRALVRLLAGAPTQAGVPEERLGQELLPCRPDDALFEPRLKAILRRHVVERSIYGVDVDPLAVELCRLALWIETMDRTLPFSFLDHKIKCGNSLVGAWFDEFQHYPVMAWKNREGGDRNHTAGVHFRKGARTAAIRAFVEDGLAPDLKRFLEGPTLFETEDLQEAALAAHAGTLAALSRLHELPVQDSAERSRIYREEFLDTEAYTGLKEALDLWCACWFWPAEKMEHAPLPSSFHRPSEHVRAVAARLASGKRFFHWELEFPDVFCVSGSGFDAVVGNPPWDIAKPNSKEFFSRYDPIYRGLGNPETRQRELFNEREIEEAWLLYNDHFNAWSNLVRYVGAPYGDPETAPKSQDRFAMGQGSANLELHTRWREARSRTNGFANSGHPFRWQGGADLNLYKLFTEQMHHLLKGGGRMGVVLPSAIYNDAGASELRSLLIENCELDWLFGFENRRKIFPIDSRVRFCCLIASRGKNTSAVRTAFGPLRSALVQSEEPIHSRDRARPGR
jgi:Eco57I restriction-modification methylase